MPVDGDRDPHDRKLTRVGGLSGEIYQPVAHCNCSHNQLSALVNRVAGVVPKPTLEAIDELKITCKMFAATVPHTVQAPLDEMPKRYSGGKRKRYEEALDFYYKFGVCKNDSFVKMFVKSERFDPEDKVNPHPRAIQYRNPVYCVVLASFLQPMEHHLYLSKFASKGVPRSRNIAKGLNSVQRAHLLVEKLSNFFDPVVLSLDASRWDKHVTLRLLQLEHYIYTLINSDPEFAQLLSWQLWNKGFSDLGMSYKVKGRRMSGDMNTAVGNCILMLTMLVTYFRLIAVNKYDILDDGDDVLAIVERADLNKVSTSVKDVFTTFGMTMKLEGSESDLHKVTFCRSRVIEYAPQQYKFVRNPKDVMSKALCGTRHWSDLMYRRRVLAAIGTCELVINLGVPVLQAFATAVLRNVGGDTDIYKYAPDGLRSRYLRDLKHLGVEAQEIRAVPIQDCARMSFYIAFDLAPDEQILLEKKLHAWQFDIATTIIKPPEVDGQWILEQSVEELYHP